MLTTRVIPCLDVKDGRVVKGVNFVDLVDAGDPVVQARLYDREGADELCFLDITASSDNRDTLYDVVALHERLDTGDACSMAPEDDLRGRSDLPDDLRHPFRLDEVRRDERDPDVVVPFLHFLSKLLQGGEIEDRRGHLEVFGDEIEPEAPVVAPDGEDPLLTGDLIVEKLELVLLPAERVVHAEGSKHGSQ